MTELVHMTRAWGFPEEHALDPGERWEARIPIAACDLGNVRSIPASQQVSPYHDATAERLITCPECLEWLADEDNRLLYFNAREWVRKHYEAGDRDLRYIDIPVFPVEDQ